MDRVLLIEDEQAIADAVLYALRSEGYAAEHALLGEQGLALHAASPFDLLLLDVGLPDVNGFEVCRRLRARDAVPVIFLTARSEEVDRIVGLELGADDYIGKPFSPREMVARVRAVLRRTRAQPQNGAEGAGVFEHDAVGQRVRFHGQTLDLTRYEYALLAKLLSRPGAVFSRSQLMDSVWRDALDTSDRTVDTHVKTLRAKLRAVREGEHLHTHRGMGYSLSLQAQ